ncbi:hypothetical protein [Streptomyces sp. NPDC048111]|uniref:hypothetical protein n=1 Tax=Streptomyces sp. NPDC048111 TaxID=3365500 RepID=UPI0037184728
MFTAPLKIATDNDDASQCTRDDGTTHCAGHTTLRDVPTAGTCQVTVTVTTVTTSALPS